MPLQSMAGIRGLESLDSPTSPGFFESMPSTPVTAEPAKNLVAPEQSDSSTSDNSSAIPIDKDVFYNQETLKYMKIIDTYKKLGIGKHIELPRLVIAGTQSCGKSSLLENLTGLPVPITTGIGTRFPIEIILIEDPTKFQVKPSIVRDPKVNDLSRNDLEKIQKFNLAQVYNEPLSQAQFESVLREASVLLGVRTPVFATDKTSRIRPVDSSAKEISSHTLQFEMRGPKFKSLSFVDTPGLYATHTRDQSDGPVQQIEDLVVSLITEKRTVIVTVMEAGQLSANQKILGLAGDADFTGDRTLGVMTKCDLVKISETDDLEATHKRARNEERFLKHGWYVVKNRSSSEAKAGISLEKARSMEMELFSQPAWSTESSHIDKNRMGISALRSGLSDVFCAHIRSEFPRFNVETRNILKKKRAQLQALGPARSTPEDQRNYLKSIVAAYQHPKSMCLNDNMRSARKQSDPTLLFRTLNEAEMSLLHLPLKKSGASRKFLSPKPELDLESDEAADASSEDEVQSGNIYSWIAQRYRDSQSRSLPGLVPPALVERLFEEQTENWSTITEQFLVRVKELFQTSLDHCLETACQNKNILPALKELVTRELDVNMAKLRRICRDLILDEQDGLHLVAGKSQFMREVREARTTRFISAMARLEHEAHLSKITVKPTAPAFAFSNPTPEPSAPFSGFGMPRNNPIPPVTPPQNTRPGSLFGGATPVNNNLFGSSPNAPVHLEEHTFQTVLNFTKINKDKFKGVITADRQIVYEIHDILKAYYSISIQHYTDAVCKNGLNSSFIESMFNIFSDKFVDSMSDLNVEDIAAETVEDRKTRRELNEDIEHLQKAIAESEAILRSSLKV